MKTSNLMRAISLNMLVIPRRKGNVRYVPRIRVAGVGVSDSEAIRSDFSAVGRDMRVAISQYGESAK